MFITSLLAIPIVSEATQATAQAQVTSYFAQPIDAIIFDVLLVFAPVAIGYALVVGFIAMWLNYRYGIYVSRLKFVLLAIDVPSFTEQTPKALENLFSTLYGAKSAITWKEKWIYGKLHPVFSFEIISTEGYIQFLIQTQTRFRDTIEAGIYAHYPDAEISEVEDYSTNYPKEYPDEEYDMWGGELTFDKDSMYPIRTYVDFEDRMTQEIKDPLGYTLEQLAKMRPGENFWIQILVQPSDNKWINKGLDHVKKIYGKEDAPKKSFIGAAAEGVLLVPSELLKEATDIDLTGLLGGETETSEDDPWRAFKITPAEKDEAEAILQKTSKVGHGVKIRIIYVAKKNAYVKIERTAMVKGILSQYSHLNLNRFTLYIPQVPKDDYFWMRWVYTKKQRKLMSAYQNRSWGVGADPIWMNAEELATLWHFPAISIKAPLVKKAESKRAEPPVGLPITHLENTLPGLEEDAAAQLATGVATAEGVSAAPPFELPTGPSLEVPLPETLPTVEPPTGARHEPKVQDEPEVPDEPEVQAPEQTPPAVEEPESAEKPTDSLVPPNLPV